MLGMGSIIPSVTTVVVLCLILFFIQSGQDTYKINPSTNIYNDSYAFESAWQNASAVIVAEKPVANFSSGTAAFRTHVYNILYSGIQFGGNAFLETGMMAREYGFTHPEFQAKDASNLLIWWLYLEIALILFMPACIVLYALWCAFVWVRDKFSPRREQ